MHQQILGGAEAPDLLPAEYPVAGKHIAVVHHPLGVVLHMLIDVVAHQHIHQLAVPHELTQLVQGLLQSGHVHPVIGVHHLVVDAPGVPDTLIDSLAVAAVLLVDGPDDIGVLLGIAVADGGGVVFGGAVVHQNDLDVVAPLEQRLHTVVHIGRRVVAGDGKGDQLIHTSFSCLSGFGRGPGRRVRSAVRPAPAPGPRWRPCCSIYIPPGGPAGAGWGTALPAPGIGHTVRCSPH